ncbi:hypothetical protein IPH67_05690 [bacterium]|nr:MAG: hypothetical protein IPH67_05690 [bacterium]
MKQSSFSGKRVQQKQLLVDTKSLIARESIAIFEPFNVQFLTVMAEANRDTLQTARTHAQNAKIKLMLDLSDSHTRAIGNGGKNTRLHGLIIHNTEDHIEPMTLIEKWEMVREAIQIYLFLSAAKSIDSSCQQCIHSNRKELLLDQQF